MKLFDWIAIIVAFVVTAGFGVLSSLHTGTATQLEVLNGKELFLFSLEENRSIEMEGPLGITRIRIGGGAAWVEDSPCPAKICITSGKISRSGEWVACLPNRIFMTVKGKTDELDAVTLSNIENKKFPTGCGCAACLKVL